MTRKLLMTLFASTALLTLCFVTACEPSTGSGSGGTNSTAETNRPPTPAPDDGGAVTTTPPPKTGG